MLKAEDDPLDKLIQLRKERLDKYLQADITLSIPSASNMLTTPEAVANEVVSTILNFIKNNPPMWKQWKDNRNKKAVEMASVVNSGATNSLVGNTDSDGSKGSIKYVSLSDIKSGKVPLPKSSNNLYDPPDGLPKEQ